MINNDIAEKALVHTTICPASSSSWFIWAAIGALETAIGVPNKAINIANSVGDLNPIKYAITKKIKGVITNLKTTDTVNCFHNFFFFFYLNLPPRITNAKGVATLPKDSIVE